MPAMSNEEDMMLARNKTNGDKSSKRKEKN